MNKGVQKISVQRLGWSWSAAQRSKCGAIIMFSTESKNREPAAAVTKTNFRLYFHNNTQFMISAVSSRIVANSTS